MKYVFILLALLLAVYAAYEYIRISRLVAVSQTLVSEASAFTRAEGRAALLVLGDSTAVGVGSGAQFSIAGRLSAALDASVENYAVSGAKARDISGQFSQHKKEAYDMVLIQIGANDIIRFTSSSAVQDELDSALVDAASVSERVVLITAGKVGEAPFFPRAFGWLWTWRAAQVRAHFIAAADSHGAVYVDLYSVEDPFSSDPGRYYAPDGLHLTADGYSFWYEETVKAIQKKWPDLMYEA